MAFSRRKFLKAGAVLSLTAAIPLRANAQQARKPVVGSDSDSAERSFPAKAEFSAYLNTSFWISMGTFDTLEIELVAVNDLKRSSTTKEPSTAKRERFSLIFQGPKNTPLKQDTYVVKHHNLGTVSIFLVPMGNDKSGTGLCYEAIVSRLIP
jgi:hypothetical protein